jgi:hypothetical protein
LDNKSLKMPEKMCNDPNMFPRLQKIFPFHILKRLFELEERGFNKNNTEDTQVNITFEKYFRCIIAS